MLRLPRLTLFVAFVAILAVLAIVWIVPDHAHAAVIVKHSVSYAGGVWAGMVGLPFLGSVLRMAADPKNVRQAGGQVGSNPVGLSAEAQHVVDALESHLKAVAAYAQTASPGALKVLGEFGDAALDKLGEWGLKFRAEFDALTGTTAATSAGGSSSAAAAPAAGASTPGKAA